MVAIISLNDFNLSALGLHSTPSGNCVCCIKGREREPKSTNPSNNQPLARPMQMCLKRHVSFGIPPFAVHGSWCLPQVRCLDETLQSHPRLSTTPNSWQYPLPSVFPLLFQTHVNFTVGGILVVPIFCSVHGNDVNFSAAPSVRDCGCKAADYSCTKRCQRITSFSSLLLQACQLHPGELWRKDDVIFPRLP